MSNLSSEQIKAATRQAWEKSANGWNRQTPQIHAWLAPATAAMLDGAHIGAGMRALDIAAGAGDQTLDIARRVGPGGSVLATDISESILQFAQENAQRAGLDNVEIRVGDAEQLRLDEASFDAAAQEAAWAAMKDKLQAFQSPSGWVGPNELLLSHGTRPAL